MRSHVKAPVEASVTITLDKFELNLLNKLIDCGMPVFKEAMDLLPDVTNENKTYMRRQANLLSKELFDLSDDERLKNDNY